MKQSTEEIQKHLAKAEASFNKTAELQQVLAKIEASLLWQEAKKMKEKSQKKF